MEKNNLITTKTDWSVQFTWLTLGFLVLANIALHIPTLSWLVGFGPAPDYSFNGDDQRFVNMAKNFDDGMKDGYVHGMTTQLLGLQALVEPFIPNVNLLQLLKVITLIYSILLLPLTYIVAKSFSLQNKWALMAVFFLVVTPVFLVCSNFGTADITAVFYFYLTILIEGKYLRTKDQFWFVLAAVLTGAAIAIKFFIPLLLPLGLLVLVHRGRQFFTQAVVASFVALASFQLMLLLNYTTADFVNFFKMLQYDNVSIASGNNPIKQIILYGWDAISALSIPVAVLFATGLVLLFVQLARSTPRAKGTQLLQIDWRSIITPRFLLFAALLAHAGLISLAGIHAPRHLLVFFPVACIAAAYALSQLSQRLSSVPLAVPTLITLIIVYCVSNAILIQRMYTNDVRIELTKSIDRLLHDGKKVVAFNRWIALRGTKYLPFISEASLDANTYVVTCDIEYNRYLRDRDVENVYAAIGGQSRVNFFWDVFEGRSRYRVVELHKQKGLGIEQKLIDSQILRPIGMFIPKSCVVLSSEGTSLSLSRSEIFPKLYYSGGW